jgi:WD40 repeat protein
VLWDIDRNKPIAKFKLGSDAAVWRIAFHPTKPLMASAHQDGSVRLWSAVDGRAQRSFPQAHAAYKRDMDRASEWTASGGARALAFDPAGELMVSGGGDGQILVYDLQRPSSRPIQLPVPLPAPGNKPPPVDSLVFVDGSHILASGQVDGPKDLWDMVRRQHLGRVGGSAEDLRAVAMSPRARRLALKHANGTASLYDWDGASLIRNACTIAGRNLSCKEWQQTFREEPYRKTCEALPEPDPPCARASR